MKLSAFSVLFKDRPLNEVLDIFHSLDITMAEVGSGGFIGKEHCNPAQLLADSKAREKFLDLFRERNMAITSLSCHGNPVHPQKALAETYHQDIKDSIDLAALIGVDHIVTFSGCPGENENSTYPNWPVSPFPEDFQTIYTWQWEKKLVPYWKQMGKYAADKGVKIALEMHGGYSVHSPFTMLKLRNETGCKSLGANLDPSHLWWQGINPVEAVRILAKDDCLFHFHAKDAAIDPGLVSLYGVLDMQSFGTAFGRAWQFRTVGYGHDLKTWADIMSALRSSGYDSAVSIEHEDSFMSVSEGLQKAVNNLKQVIIFEQASRPKAFDLDERFK